MEGSGGGGGSGWVCVCEKTRLRCIGARFDCIFIIIIFFLRVLCEIEEFRVKLGKAFPNIAIFSVVIVLRMLCFIFKVFGPTCTLAES